MCDTKIFTILGIILTTYALSVWLATNINYTVNDKKYDMKTGCKFKHYNCTPILCYDKQLFGCAVLGGVFWICIMFLFFTIYVIYAIIRYNLIYKKYNKEFIEIIFQFPDDLE